MPAPKLTIADVAQLAAELRRLNVTRFELNGLVLEFGDAPEQPPVRVPRDTFVDTRTPVKPRQPEEPTIADRLDLHSA